MESKKPNKLRYIIMFFAVLLIITAGSSKPQPTIKYDHARVERQEAAMIKLIERRQEQIEARREFLKNYYANECTFEGHFRDYLRYTREDSIAKYYASEYGYDAYKEWQEAYTAYLEEQARIAYEEEQARIRYEEEQARLKAAQYAASGSVADYQNYAYSLFSNYGWSSYDFECLVALWNRESKWNPLAHNNSSGAHGIPQSLPASKMASHGADYWDNGYTQIRWGLDYISGRYGSPTNAWAHSQNYGWY